MKKALSLILLFAFVYPASAAKIATTHEGEEVLLKDNGTWEYIKKEGDFETEELRLYTEIKDTLRPHFFRRTHNVFVERFKVPVNWDNEFDQEYKNVLKALYKRSQRRRSQRFYSELAEAFGIQTADQLKFLFENWQSVLKIILES